MIKKTLYVLSEGSWVECDPTAPEGFSIIKDLPVEGETVRYKLANGETLEVLYSNTLVGQYQKNSDAIWKLSENLDYSQLVLEILESDHVVINRIYETEELPVIRSISLRAFRMRLTTEEKIAVLESTDSTVRVMTDDLSLTPYIDLDSATLEKGLQYLEYVEILAIGRIEVLLQDGRTSELR